MHKSCRLAPRRIDGDCNVAARQELEKIEQVCISPVFGSKQLPSKFALKYFITSYCSERRLGLKKAVVLRFRLHLESLGMAGGTIISDLQQ